MAILTGGTRAENNPANTTVMTAQTFYAYVQAGETLDAIIGKVNKSAHDADAVLTISRPGAADVSCTIVGADPAGSNCNLMNVSAGQTAIWKIQFNYTPSADGNTHDRFMWDFTVKDASANPISGRVWVVGDYHLHQQAIQTDDADMTVWYQSEFGYQYRVRYLTYNGIDSFIGASSVGLVDSANPSDCVPIYRSTDHGDTTFALPPTDCPQFKMFFDEPAADLPASAPLWDGSTDWIVPPIVNPAVSDMGFTQDFTGARSGDITFDLQNFTGALKVQVDANNNGSYDDPQDVTIPYTATDTGPQSVPFDGNDGAGNPILLAQPITFRVLIDRAAEIHFVGFDIEQWAGGIEVLRLNGPAGDEDVIYWNDTQLGSTIPEGNTQRCGTIPPLLDGTAGINSTGGVHGWDNATCTSPGFGNGNNGITGSWGDYRYIDNWAFASIEVTDTYALAGYIDVTPPITPPLVPTDPTNPTNPSGGDGAPLADTGINLAVVVAAAVTLMALSVGVMAAILKKKLPKAL